MTVRLTGAGLRRVIRDVRRELAIPAGFDLDLAGAGDLDRLLYIAQACFAHDTPDRAEIRYFLERAHAVFFVFKRAADRAIVGYALIEANAGNQSLYNNTTCLLPECRGLGLGAAFYALKEKLPVLLGYRSIAAHVAIDNRRSIELFQLHGFKISERIASYYDDGRDAFKFRLQARPDVTRGDRVARSGRE